MRLVVCNLAGHSLGLTLSTRYNVSFIQIYVYIKNFDNPLTNIIVLNIKWIIHNFRLYLYVLSISLFLFIIMIIKRLNICISTSSCFYCLLWLFKWEIQIFPASSLQTKLNCITVKLFYWQSWKNNVTLQCTSRYIFLLWSCSHVSLNKQNHGGTC